MEFSFSRLPLALLFLSGIFLSSPSKAQNPVDPPKGLKLVFIHVGQGDATLVMGPTGKALLFDAGPDGQGTRAILPQMQKLGVKSLEGIMVSHYHPDHIGGVDEVLAKVPTKKVYDRGTYKAPTYYKDYGRYSTAARGKRTTVRPGTTIDLGPGVTCKVIAVNGYILGSSSRLPIDKAYQYENGASITLKVSYGDFSLWLGGDLTGGGLNTYDLESRVAAVAGKVDVYQADHHGSATSTNSNLLRLLDPEVVVISCGKDNPFRHPAGAALNRMNSAGTSRLVLCTSPGNGYRGFGTSGTTVLTTNGRRYRITGETRGELDLYTDEARVHRPIAGELVLSEVQRNPSKKDGKYLELTYVGKEPASLEGLELRGNKGFFRVASPYRLLPGQSLLLMDHGDPGRNGGLPLGHAWPYKAMSLGASSDRIRIGFVGRTLESLSYSSSFAGGYGVAAERVDLLAGARASNFQAATQRYGSDRGTPGKMNGADRTRYGLWAGVETVPFGRSGGPKVLALASALGRRGAFDILALSLGTSPGLRVGSVHIPLNGDQMFLLSLQLPGSFGAFPSEGRRGWELPIPRFSSARGRTLFFGHFLVDFFGANPIPAASNAFTFRIP
jgi:beta-lactamase superfamily II metal-dependent hydrolase